MDGGEGVKLGSGNAAPDRIWNSIPHDELCQFDNVNPSGVAVFTAQNLWGWGLFDPLEAAIGDDFVPYLMGGSMDEISDNLHKHIICIKKRLGSVIPDPNQNPSSNFQML